MKRKISYAALGLIIALAAGYSVFRFAFGTHLQTGYHLASVDWLPASATDISFCRRQGFAHLLVYEFRISEPDFQAFARNHNWQLTSATHDCNVVRFTYFLPAEDTERREPFYITAETGYCYDNRTPGGAGIRALYDSSTSTAYVQHTSH